jgi:hypothetical protein
MLFFYIIFDFFSIVLLNHQEIYILYTKKPPTEVDGFETEFLFLIKNWLD